MAFGIGQVEVRSYLDMQTMIGQAQLIIRVHLAMPSH